MIFTAATVLAFSAIATANTKEEKKDTKEAKKTPTVEETDKGRTPCDSYWIASYELYVSRHEGSAGSAAAYKFADGASTTVGC